jgi:uncharacterized paraquat-inducible protein A
VKCKSCSVEFPGSIWYRLKFQESVCPRCGQRHPTDRQLRFEVIAMTTIAILYLMLAILDETPFLLGLVLLAGTVVVWAEYLATRKRRRGST